MKTAETILSQTLQRHKPSLVVCSYSGGYDSMVATHKTLLWAKQYAHSANVSVASVDTQISADGWKEYVKQSAREIGAVRFELWQSSRFAEWFEGIRSKGFGYTKAIHTIYFRQLKESAFRAILAHHKKHRHDRIMFVTGMRRLESRERANTPESARHGSYVWCNPLVHWNEQDIHTYRLSHQLPENPFYVEGLGSGDCLCNWHGNITLTLLQERATNATKIILPLQEECRRTFGYGYGERPSDYRQQESAGQLSFLNQDGEVPNLCAGCERPRATTAQREYLLMQRLEW